MRIISTFLIGMTALVVFLASCKKNDTPAPTTPVTPKEVTLKVYPNPTTNLVNVEVTDYIGDSLTTVLFNRWGTAVFEQTKSVQADSVKSQIDLSQFPLGVYYLRVYGAGFDVRQSVVKTS
jgi:hypothetical protein